jgi:hypothetical protein
MNEAGDSITGSLKALFCWNCCVACIKAAAEGFMSIRGRIAVAIIGVMFGGGMGMDLDIGGMKGRGIIAIGGCMGKCAGCCMGLGLVTLLNRMLPIVLMVVASEKK